MTPTPTPTPIDRFHGLHQDRDLTDYPLFGADSSRTISLIVSTRPGYDLPTEEKWLGRSAQSLANVPTFRLQSTKHPQKDEPLGTDEQVVTFSQAAYSKLRPFGLLAVGCGQEPSWINRPDGDGDEQEAALDRLIDQYFTMAAAIHAMNPDQLVLTPAVAFHSFENDIRPGSWTDKLCDRLAGYRRAHPRRPIGLSVHAGKRCDVDKVMGSLTPFMKQTGAYLAFTEVRGPLDDPGDDGWFIDFMDATDLQYESNLSATKTLRTLGWWYGPVEGSPDPILNRQRLKDAYGLTVRGELWKSLCMAGTS